MTGNPFLIPKEGHWVINFSGGRSSGYMLWRIIDAHGGTLPNNTTVIFANTGKEHPATLDFVKQCGDEWDVKIVWLEYHRRNDRKGGIKDPKNHYRIVDHKTASRKGEPFEQLIESRQMLPNPVMRMCTSELKVATIQRYLMRELGIQQSEHKNILGIRADEQRRVNKALMEQCRVIYPMVYAGTTENHVFDFWKCQSFDLEIPSYMGNCDLCFLKGKKILIDIIRHDPPVAQWWLKQENKIKVLDSDKTGHFNKMYSFADIVDEATTQSTLDFGDELDPLVDCFCGD